MTKVLPVVFWFCPLVLVQAEVPEPAQCLVSELYSLIRQPEPKDDGSCWDDCWAAADCHMAVVTEPLSGSGRCLLVNCQNRGSYSFPREASAEISVYPKSSAGRTRALHLSQERVGTNASLLHRTGPRWTRVGQRET